MCPCRATVDDDNLDENDLAEDDEEEDYEAEKPPAKKAKGAAKPAIKGAAAMRQLATRKSSRAATLGMI